VSKYGELRYKAWGKIRYAWRTTPTDYRYTGQRQYDESGGDDGLYFYNARRYDPAPGRFIQMDSIVPNPGHPGA